MVRIDWCPIVGGPCNKPGLDIGIAEDTFFLAEPFRPQEERRRREQAIRNALRESLKEKFSESSLRVADKEPKEPAVFCDICRMIQSSSYGIADISRLNSNTLLELGMMFALGKPVFILVKKKEEESLRRKLPSDILWKRIIDYEEYIDIEEELAEMIKHRPEVEPRPSLGEEVERVVTKIDPRFARELNRKLQEFREEQRLMLKELRGFMKHAKPSSIREIGVDVLSEKANMVYNKVEPIERLVGTPKGLSDNERALNAITRGLSLYGRKQYGKALDLFNLALNITPNNLNALHFKGHTCVWLARFREAISCYKEILRTKPNDIFVIQDLSEAFILQGNFLKGLKMAEKASRLSKQLRNKLVSLFLRGLGHFLVGEKKKAHNEIDELTDLLSRYAHRLKWNLWEFSPLESLIKKKLRGKDRQKMLSIIALLQGRV